jgi:hypothetical protein
LVEECSVLVGLHPDQATGAIVEAAIHHRRPFAVVPCCVFAREFPCRSIPARLSSAATVQSTAAAAAAAADGATVAAVVAAAASAAGTAAEARVKAGGEMEYVAVETVNDLVSWLLAKHPRMRTAMLNFEGRNKVVYMREEDYRDEGGSLSLVT